MKFNNETVCTIVTIASFFSCAETPNKSISGYMSKFSAADQKNIESLADNNKEKTEKIAKVIYEITEKYKVLPDYKTMPNEMKNNLPSCILMGLTMNKDFKEKFMKNLYNSIKINDGTLFLGDLPFNSVKTAEKENFNHPKNDNPLQMCNQLLSLTNNDYKLAEKIYKCISDIIRDIEDIYKRNNNNSKIKSKSEWIIYLSDHKNKAFKELFIETIRNYKHKGSYSLDEIKVDDLVLPKDLYKYQDEKEKNDEQNKQKVLSICDNNESLYWNFLNAIDYIIKDSKDAEKRNCTFKIVNIKSKSEWINYFSDPKNSKDKQNFLNEIKQNEFYVNLINQKLVFRNFTVPEALCEVYYECLEGFSKDDRQRIFSIFNDEKDEDRDIKIENFASTICWIIDESRKIYKEIHNEKPIRIFLNSNDKANSYKAEHYESKIGSKSDWIKYLSDPKNKDVKETLLKREGDFHYKQLTKEKITYEILYYGDFEIPTSLCSISFSYFKKFSQDDQNTILSLSNQDKCLAEKFARGIITVLSEIRNNLSDSRIKNETQLVAYFSDKNNENDKNCFMTNIDEEISMSGTTNSMGDTDWTVNLGDFGIRKEIYYHYLGEFSKTNQEKILSMVNSNQNLTQKFASRVLTLNNISSLWGDRIPKIGEKVKKNKAVLIDYFMKNAKAKGDFVNNLDEDLKYKINNIGETEEYFAIEDVNGNLVMTIYERDL